MHLVRIRHLFYPDMPRDYFFELCQRQVAFGYRVGLVTWNKSGKRPPSQSIEGFTIYRIPGPNVGSSFLPEYPILPGLPKVVSALVPDIIHAESHLFLPTAQAIRTAARLKVPGIVTVHGLRVSRGPLVDLAEGLYLRTVARRVFETASRVICLTEIDARDTAEYGCPAGKISVVPNGVDSELFRPGDKPMEKLILWTGRFVPEKGLPNLLRAAKTVAARVERVKFLLVGFGPGRSKIEQMARGMGLSPGIVEFEGPVTREEIAEILRRAMVFAFPSLQEGLPLSLLEAMASGRPVVSTKIPVVQEVISDGENGLLVNPGDSQELARVIETLLLDEGLRTKLGENTRKTALAKYSWSLVLGKLDEIYREAREAKR